MLRIKVTGWRDGHIIETVFWCKDEVDFCRQVVRWERREWIDEWTRNVPSGRTYRDISLEMTVRIPRLSL